MTALTSDPSPLATGGDTTPVARFMHRVLADPAAQARLGACELPDAYVAAAIELSDGTVDAAALQPLMRRDPLGLGRFAVAPVTLDHWPGPGWLPARSVADANGPAFDWAWFGDARPADPFYEDAVRRVTNRPFNLMFRTRTPLDALIADPAARNAPPPAGLIFHMSRCGSTLAARMLRGMEHAVVVSEPEPLDAIVQWTRSGARQDRHVAAVRAVAAALGRQAPGGRFFIKLDSWHTLDLPLFRAAFPATPWIFLYRDPVEVMVSHAAQPGAQTVPGVLGGDVFGLAVDAMPPLDYAAAALGRICGAVLEHWPLGGGMLVDYREIASAMHDTIPRHFGLNPTLRERAAIGAAAGANAKYPETAFTPDSTNKREQATAAVRAAAAAHLAPVHAALERMRALQG